jgi:hypothetical protein
MIELGNALAAALVRDDLAGDGELRPSALTAVGNHLAAARDDTAALLFVVCVVIIVILLASTACSMLVRFAALLVLTAVAPLALACHALPQTDPVARLWWRSYGVALAIPIGQGLTLYAGHWMLVDSGAMLPDLGLPVEVTGTVNLLIVMVLLWTTVKVPGLMARHLSGGGQRPNVLGMVARVVVVQQLSRAVPGLGRTARAVAR